MIEPVEKKYKQLALFSTIVGEVFLTPCILGGSAYFLFKSSDLQITLTVIAAIVGLVVAFYRIFKIVKTQNRNEDV